MLIDIIFLCVDDIFVLCVEGVIVMGIIGSDLIVEVGIKVLMWFFFGVGKCCLVVCVFDDC